MTKSLRSFFLSLLVVALAGAGYARGDSHLPMRSVMESPDDRATREQLRLERQVRHELVMLPFFGVFDHLIYRVQDATVTLGGHVTRPTLKNDAERLVKRIEGVEKVQNEIDVLPLSPYDDRLRLALYRAIYGHPSLTLYQVRALAPIQIVVKNGNVTLEGFVATELDRNLAGIQANGVPGIFSVTNNLIVDGGGARKARRETKSKQETAGQRASATR